MPNGGGPPYRFNANLPLEENRVPSPIHTSDSEDAWENKKAYRKEELRRASLVMWRLVPPHLRIEDVLTIIVAHLLCPRRGCAPSASTDVGSSLLPANAEAARSA